MSNHKMYGLTGECFRIKLLAARFNRLARRFRSSPPSKLAFLLFLVIFNFSAVPGKPAPSNNEPATRPAQTVPQNHVAPPKNFQVPASAFSNKVKTSAANASTVIAPSVVSSHPNGRWTRAKVVSFLKTLSMAFLGLLLLLKIVPLIKERLVSRWHILGVLLSPDSEYAPQAMLEDENIAKWMAGNRVGPQAQPSRLEPAAAESSYPTAGTITDHAKAETHSLKDFFEWVPGHMIDVHYLFNKIGRLPKDDAGKKAAREKLVDLAVELRRLRCKATLPELVPALQMTTALEGLLKQLLDRSDTLNQSTVRTLGGGLSLLGELCAPELRVDIATNPPIKILVVDDDAVCRFTLSSSIKKFFDMPDLAQDGETALSKTESQIYDLIFMDVNMPGMNGFEACVKIHEQPLNQSTPTVFVTSMKDFESHAKSVSSGGCDLIGKPFLNFEIAVKALTLVLQNRLRLRDRMVDEANSTTNFPTAVAADDCRNSPQSGATAPPLLDTLTPARDPSGETKLVPNDTAIVERKTLQPDRTADAGSPSMPSLQSISASLAEMRNELRLISQSSNETERWEKLLVLHQSIQSVTQQIDLLQSRPAFQLCCALQGLFKKLREKPSNIGASTLFTATAAVELLIELCGDGTSPNLVSAQPLNILVVDDEPLARWALVNSLQKNFSKSDSVENGEQALILARERGFDAIFLDVEMPGMDGFELCRKIRETVPNRSAPVIFVTSHRDFKSRAESARCGAADFVVKPFLFAEITVKTLTVALRYRLQKRRNETVQELPKPVTAVKSV